MPRSRTLEEGPHPVDVHVGQRVKSRRLAAGLSQDELAKACHITFQQVQKYERGTNRISVSRLTEISQALKSPIEHFTEGLSALLPGGTKQAQRGFAETKQTALDAEAHSRDEIELLKAYRAISGAKMKKQVVEMAKALGASAKGE